MIQEDIVEKMNHVKIDKVITDDLWIDSIGQYQGQPVLVRELTSNSDKSREVEIINIIAPHINVTRPLFYGKTKHVETYNNANFRYNVIVYPYDEKRECLGDIYLNIEKYNINALQYIASELSRMIARIHQLDVVHGDLNMTSVFVSWKDNTAKSVDKVYLEGWNYAFLLKGKYLALKWRRDYNCSTKDDDIINLKRILDNIIFLNLSNK